MSTKDSHAPGGGVLVVDKPTGLTSHDVVDRVRRALSIRRVGHAGTLDPLASGVLVVMVGAATKLAPYLAGDDKSYRATVWLGAATDTLDAEGAVTQQAPLPSWFFDEQLALPRLAAALDAERARTEQQPPTYSALKVGGQRAYARARAGKPVDLPARPVEVHQLELIEHGPVSEAGERVEESHSAPVRGELELSLRVTKGYYVRALARDLGQQLGLPSHLHALQRTASGPFALDRAVSIDEPAEPLSARLIPLPTAAQMALPAAVLTDDGRRRALQGKRLALGDFAAAPPVGTAAWLDSVGQLVAVGDWSAGGQGRVRRGFGG